MVLVPKPNQQLHDIDHSLAMNLYGCSMKYSTTRRPMAISVVYEPNALDSKLPKSQSNKQFMEYNRAMDRTKVRPLSPHRMHRINCQCPGERYHTTPSEVPCSRPLAELFWWHERNQQNIRQVVLMLWLICLL